MKAKNLLNWIQKTGRFFILCCLLFFSIVPQAWAADLGNGEKVFQANCVGCHVNGGNIIRRGKNLKLKALQKNGYGDVGAIASIVTNGKANMSAYKDRLTQQEIENVAAYVLEQAQKGWQK
ncbi:c-type cytochrome [Phormidium sp. LEGE 05292]|uniref:c-type cytochrome n=1 Tax=[Phormidium] sp. LEGE 05292 TaxID=767427 RepID=UPI0018821B14|nr:c-type cytochrome [Phormidium sp. LEGE 05292]MBE9226780.1 c-type cytochrome [Phormidium sp. LEGE 05292]